MLSLDEVILGGKVTQTTFFFFSLIKGLSEKFKNEEYLLIRYVFIDTHWTSIEYGHLSRFASGFGRVPTNKHKLKNQ